jgi:non-ribosomal peptide synthetase component F
LYVTLLAAFQVLLYRYSGQADICVGSPVAGRKQQELEGLVGFFVNTVVLRSEVKGERSFRELLGQVKETTLGAYEHQEVPFEKVVMFSLQKLPEVPEQGTAQFDLSFYLQEQPSGISLNIVYNTDLFSEDTIDRMAGHYIELLRSIVSDAGAMVGRLRMLTAGEGRQVLEEFNDSRIAYPWDKTVVDWIKEQVMQGSEAVAVIFEGQELTYGELDRRSDQLSHYLQGLGVKEKTLVPICVERSFGMLIGVLGILKAGGAYVLIDPEYPAERIHFILKDSGSDILVTSGQCRGKTADAEAGRIVVEIDKVKVDAINQ